jgi:hypothetical protein
MAHRRVRLLLGLLVLVAMGYTSLDAQPSPHPGDAPPPLPPDPAEWVCQDSVRVVSPATIEAWCRMPVDRGRPAPMTLQLPPPLGLE